eukprot:4078757-Lingulodinium_polyedra.AAC.1
MRRARHHEVHLHAGRPKRHDEEGRVGVHHGEMIPSEAERAPLRIAPVGKLAGDPELHAAARPLARARGQDE